MNRRFGSVLIFSVIVAALASLLVYHFVLTSVEAASRTPHETKKQLVAAHTLEVGALIHDGDLRWSNTAGLIGLDVVNDQQQAVGRGVIAAIYEGEPITAARLAPRGAGAGMASMIPLGKRAVALKIDEVIGLAGFVVPGMRVDVIIAGRSSDSSQNNVFARTVLQNIEVLSAGQKIEKTAEGKPQDAQVVNLLVTPDEAEVLSLASNETKVQLVLRNPMDTQQATTHGASMLALFGLHDNTGASAKPTQAPRVARASAPPKPPAPLATVEVFSGIKKSEQTLASQ